MKKSTLRRYRYKRTYKVKPRVEQTVEQQQKFKQLRDQLLPAFEQDNKEQFFRIIEQLRQLIKK